MRSEREGTLLPNSGGRRRGLENQENSLSHSVVTKSPCNGNTCIGTVFSSL